MAEEKTPTQLADEAAAKTAAKAARDKYINEVKIAVNAAPTDPNVRIVLKHIMNICGFQANPVVVGANGEVQVSSTIYNVGMEAPYHDLRRLMSTETKNAVERSE